MLRPYLGEFDRIFAMIDGLCNWAKSTAPTVLIHNPYINAYLDVPAQKLILSQMQDLRTFSVCFHFDRAIEKIDKLIPKFGNKALKKDFVEAGPKIEEIKQI